MANEIDNAIKSMKNTVDNFLAMFSGNNGNTNKNMNIRTNNYVQPQNNGIKFSDMGPHNVRLSQVVYDSNPVVNGIKFNSD